MGGDKLLAMFSVITLSLMIAVNGETRMSLYALYGQDRGLQNNNRLYRHTTDTVTECLSHCSLQSGCDVISYHQGEDECWGGSLSGETVLDATEAKANSIVFYVSSPFIII